MVILGVHLWLAHLHSFEVALMLQGVLNSWGLLVTASLVLSRPSLHVAFALVVLLPGQLAKMLCYGCFKS